MRERERGGGGSNKRYVHVYILLHVMQYMQSYTHIVYTYTEYVHTRTVMSIILHTCALK